jgi:transglutaminase-like putative cysteine protease
MAPSLCRLGRRERRLGGCAGWRIRRILLRRACILAAAETFAVNRGTCQGLTHVFIAIAHSARQRRYVSGYLHRPDAVAVQDGGHAWAEAHVPELGWVGFDPTEGLCVTDRHIRIAIGLDGLGAARVRGAHYGGGREVLAVKLQVTQASWQTQG